MFTGIIEAVGRIESLETSGELARLRVEAGRASEAVKLGDSVSVSGACLTVTAIDGTQLCFEAVRETLERTAIGALEAGARVNLERAMPAGGRLDGHIVQGHVDGMGEIERLDRLGDDVQLFVRCGAELADLLVEKGSVAVDGVSLTVCGSREDGFDVVLIPHTLAETTLGGLAPGDRVNVEVDVLGKYVKAYLDRRLGGTLEAGRSAQLGSGTR